MFNLRVDVHLLLSHLFILPVVSESGWKWGDKNWEEWSGGVWGRAVPSPFGVCGLAPRQKLNFAL